MPENLFVGLITFVACTVGVLDALRIHAAETRFGAAPCLVREPRQPDFFNACSSKSWCRLQAARSTARNNDALYDAISENRSAACATGSRS
jgi:hypothetical protein